MKYQVTAPASRRAQSPSRRTSRKPKVETLPRDAQPAQVAEANALLMSVVRDLLYVEDRASGLPLRQLRVCASLYDGPLAMSEVSRRLGMTLSAMTQIADRLERAGMVTRLANGPDRRVRCLTLTARGRRAMQLREKVRLERLTAVFDTLDDGARQDLMAGLKIFREACAAVANHDQ